MNRATQQDRITVILPIRNEESYIAATLGSVLDQDYPEELVEVLVVDGQSSDRTREIVEGLIDQYSERHLQLIDNPERIVATALNRGVVAAKGEFIVRVDGHCQIEPNHLTAAAEVLASDEADCVGGPIETVGQTPLSRAIASAMSSRFGVGDSTFRTDFNHRGLVDTVPFPAYRREVLEAVGPFDEELVRNQDDEHNYRLRKMGFRVFLEPRMRSRYFSRSSLRSLWRQYFQYGFWKVRVLQKHPAQMRSRQFVPPGLVASLLVASAVLPWSTLPLILVTAVYGLAVLSTSALAIFSHRQGALAWLSLVFPALHLSYGCGFLWGLARFAGRWRSSSTPETPTPSPTQ